MGRHRNRNRARNLNKTGQIGIHSGQFGNVAFKGQVFPYKSDSGSKSRTFQGSNTTLTSQQQTQNWRNETFKINETSASDTGPVNFNETYMNMAENTMSLQNMEAANMSFGMNTVGNTGIFIRPLMGMGSSLMPVMSYTGDIFGKNFGHTTSSFMGMSPWSASSEEVNMSQNNLSFAGTPGFSDGDLEVSKATNRNSNTTNISEHFTNTLQQGNELERDEKYDRNFGTEHTYSDSMKTDTTFRNGYQDNYMNTNVVDTGFPANNSYENDTNGIGNLAGENFQDYYQQDSSNTANSNEMNCTYLGYEYDSNGNLMNMDRRLNDNQLNDSRVASNETALERRDSHYDMERSAVDKYNTGHGQQRNTKERGNSEYGLQRDSTDYGLQRNNIGNAYASYEMQSMGDSNYGEPVDFDINRNTNATDMYRERSDKIYDMFYIERNLKDNNRNVLNTNRNVKYRNLNTADNGALRFHGKVDFKNRAVKKAKARVRRRDKKGRSKQPLEIGATAGRRAPRSIGELNQWQAEAKRALHKPNLSKNDKTVAQKSKTFLSTKRNVDFKTALKVPVQASMKISVPAKNIAANVGQLGLPSRILKIDSERQKNKVNGDKTTVIEKKEMNKRMKSRMFECPIEDCKKPKAENIKTHAYKYHIPSVFNRDLDPKKMASKRGEALNQLAQMCLGQFATLSDVSEYLDMLRIMEDKSVYPALETDAKEICLALGFDIPDKFTLLPMSTPALVVEWQALLFLISQLESEQRAEFHASYDVPLPLFDKGDTGITSLPRVVDTCFHMDWTRTALKLEPPAGLKEICEAVRPGDEWNVKVASAVAVFSDPVSYPSAEEVIKLHKQGLSVSLGVSPRYANEFTVENLQCLKDLVNMQEIVAVGEIGLDHSVPAHQWAKQHDILHSVLRLVKPRHVLMLHCTSMTNESSSEVYTSLLYHLKGVVRQSQRMHLHDFSGTSDVVTKWLEHFPDTYFGFSSLVNEFDEEQLKALKMIHLSKLLIETNAPEGVVLGHDVSTPNLLGFVAKDIAEKLAFPVRQLLYKVTSNARKLYLYS